jgi:hypothetical protein
VSFALQFRVFAADACVESNGGELGVVRERDQFEMVLTDFDHFVLEQDRCVQDQTAKGASVLRFFIILVLR